MSDSYKRNNRKMERASAILAILERTDYPPARFFIEQTDIDAETLAKLAVTPPDPRELFRTLQ